LVFQAVAAVLAYLLGLLDFFNSKVAKDAELSQAEGSGEKSVSETTSEVGLPLACAFPQIRSKLKFHISVTSCLLRQEQNLFLPIYAHFFWYMT
jgi:hypothetical protein